MGERIWRQAIGGNDSAAPVWLEASDGARETASSASRAVVLVTGSVPGTRCGVEDYTMRLAKQFETAGMAHRLLRGCDWSPLGTMRTLRALRAARPSIIHIQYPALGYGRSLGPHMAALMRSAPSVVTLHEYCAFGTAMRAALGLFARAAHHIVFTTHFERSRFLAQFPHCRERSSVIPIGSNIPFVETRVPATARILFFGQIRPGRGVEAALALAQLAKARGRGWQVVIMGSALPAHAGYLTEMRASAAGRLVEWLLDLGDAEVALQLAGATAAYLPYPDGVSERRGSLLAALGNGVPVVTTDGPFRPLGLERAVCFAATPAEALRRVDEIVDHPENRDALRAAGRQYAIRHDWGGIAEAHRSLYRRLAVSFEETRA